MPVATRWVNERATSALGIRPSACKANRPVSGWGQGRQPPEAVARSASLEASRSRVYLKKYSCSPVTGLFCHRRLADMVLSKPGWADATPQNLTPASGRQDHTILPSAKSVSRPRAIDHSQVFRPALRSHRAQDAAASTASLPASVTIAIRPSVGWDEIGYSFDLGQV